MGKESLDNHELRGLSKTELMKLARSKKLRVSETIKREDLITRLDAVMKMGKLKKLIQAQPAKGVPLPLGAKVKKRKAAQATKAAPAKAAKKRKLTRVKIQREPKKIILAPPRIRRKKEIVPEKVSIPSMALRPGREEQEIEEKKYYVAPAVAPEPQREQREEWPEQYGRNRIALLARDPEWLFSYWEIVAEKLEEARKYFGPEWEATRTILRVYDISGIDFNGANARSFFDIELKGNATNWYIHAGKPNADFIVDIARVSPSGKFFVLARSNKVRTPRSRPSDVIDEEWMSLDFEKLYGLSGGLRIGASSAEFRRMMEKGLPIGISSASGGIFSAASPVKKKQRGFWFVVDAELIVYGATEPDAKVWVQGKEVKLRPDGTFTLRFALPDGLQNIPATAESPDKLEERTITIDVTRKTRQEAPKVKEELHV